MSLAQQKRRRYEYGMFVDIETLLRKSGAVIHHRQLRR